MVDESSRRLPTRFSIAWVLGLASILSACDTIKSIERHGLAAGAFHAAYCEADADTREQLDLMVVFEDGSPKLDVHCEPRRREDEEFHPPRL